LGKPASFEGGSWALVNFENTSFSGGAEFTSTNVDGANFKGASNPDGTKLTVRGTKADWGTFKEASFTGLTIDGEAVKPPEMKSEPLVPTEALVEGRKTTPEESE
jgi:hypothetical protein